MKRLHPPDLRRFEPAVEDFADLMMDNPVRQAEDFQLKFETTRGPATITMPDGFVLEGYVVRRGSNAATELFYAMTGTDLGAPTVPYIYFPDARVVFSPVPFDNAHHIRDDRYHKVSPFDLGVRESLARWINKPDDHSENTLYGGDGEIALIDNALAYGRSTLNYGVAATTIWARRSCCGGSRAFAYRRGRITMAKRIEKYPLERLDMIKQRISETMPECERHGFADDTFGYAYDEAARRRAVVRHPLSLWGALLGRQPLI